MRLDEEISAADRKGHYLSSQMVELSNAAELLGMKDLAASLTSYAAQYQACIARIIVAYEESLPADSRDGHFGLVHLSAEIKALWARQT